MVDTVMGIFDDFLDKALSDSVNGGSGRFYAAGIRADAGEVNAGRSKYQPEEREAPKDPPEPSVLHLYEETLCRPLKAAIKMRRRRR
jgi:hypothetical protein